MASLLASIAIHDCDKRRDRRTDTGPADGITHCSASQLKYKYKKQRYNCFISNTKYIRFCVFLPLDASLYHSRISHFLFTVHTSPGSHTSHLTSHLHRGCLCRELDQILQYVIKGICSVRISLSLLLIRRRSDIL